MLPIILGVVAVAVLGLVAFVATRPAEFSISPHGRISAPPAAVFAQVNDFHNWQQWSPWAKLDPAAKSTFEGPSSGNGAIFRWEGNKKVGQGNMTIVESRPSDLIRIRLEFIKPFAAVNTTLFTFQPEGSQTVVTWTMTGKNNFFAKAFCMCMNMDKMVGGDFEKGLASIKGILESGRN